MNKRAPKKMSQFTPNQNTKTIQKENQQKTNKKEKGRFPTKKTHKNKTKYKTYLYIILSFTLYRLILLV